MKKILAVLLSTLMIATLFAGCGAKAVKVTEDKPAAVSSLKFKADAECMHCGEKTKCAKLKADDLEFAYCEDCANTCAGCDGQADNMVFLNGSVIPVCDDCQDIMEGLADLAE